MSNVTAEQKKEVKGRGFLPSRDGEHFAARIITVNGVINASQAKKIAEAAEKFGNGQLAFTTRLTVELPGVKFEDIEALSEFIASENLITGGTGSRVRPVVAF
ncbi:nitrate/sulfite reductase [Clostridioides difficile]|nr:nitrate/sulfite reductase [Clostridioides difficile]EQK93967.1 nitrite/Sulfite reductase ferredoxin-like half domain protein [Clostridioides difficile CD127]EQE09203.1 nitrite/Sulfite reductase ferredoxin-like half domain protein [Clostridioides difficile CD3]EQF43854.1 nitrite/Sulfite reductase ferredoxin-like half domain protein [Clostridioides difficile CD175]EQG29076.1 nitrite/Sulfite reductase ferredoxin-like half domain protein [Clostridioides difficile DA00126]EQG66828.1 nitrite/Sulf